MKKFLIAGLSILFLPFASFAKPGVSIPFPDPPVQVAAKLATDRFNELSDGSFFRGIPGKKFSLQQLRWKYEQSPSEGSPLIWFWEALFVNGENSEFYFVMQIFPDKSVKITRKHLE